MAEKPNGVVITNNNLVKNTYTVNAYTVNAYTVNAYTVNAYTVNAYTVNAYTVNKTYTIPEIISSGNPICINISFAAFIFDIPGIIS